MNAIDFEFDGQYLSDFGFIICSFDSYSGAETVTAGSVLTFNKISKHYGKSFSLASTEYKECITTSFDICKDPDKYEDLRISSDEFRDIMRWLNRREFCKFQVFDPDREYDTCYYNASFIIEKITIHEKLYGIHLEMETDKPFGYGEEKFFKIMFDANSTHMIYDMQDEIGFIYPNIKIICNSAGNLELHNSLCDCTTIINNCSFGEVIESDGELQIITSSDNTHAICDDFNFEFFQIGNTYNDRSNYITSSLPCILEIRYSPIIKDVP